MICETYIDYPLLLKYLKVLLSSHVVIGVVAFIIFCFLRKNIKGLIDRIIKITIPGGGGIQTHQMPKIEPYKKNIEKENIVEPIPEELKEIADNNSKLSKDLLDKIINIFKIEKTKTYLWEYNYLNLFLVSSTQKILDFIVGSNFNSINLSYIDTLITQIAPNFPIEEKKVIVEVLKSHHLITVDNNEFVNATPKGKEYVQWRGPLK